MSSPPPKYRKLPGRGIGVGEASRLFLAEDHLLLVTASGFSESYRRFYLRDIQSITTRKTATWWIVNGAGGFILFWMIVGLIAAGAGETFGWSIAVGFFTAVLCFNLVRGPTCVCEIHTAVQSRRLGSVNRLRTALKLLARLRPLVEAAQGPLPVEELRQRIDQSRQQSFPEAAPPVIRPAGW